MTIRKILFVGIICVLGLTGCTANSKSGTEGGGEERTEEVLSMSRSELAKQESFNIEIEQQQETTSFKIKEPEDKHWSSGVTFYVDYVANPYTIHLKSKSDEGKEEEKYLSDTEFHKVITEDIFLKQEDTETIEKEKKTLQRFIDPYDYIDIYHIDSQNIIISEEEERYILSIDISSDEANKETLNLMKKNYTDRVKLKYTLDKTTLLPQVIEVELFSSLKSKNLNSESVLTSTTHMSNYNGIKEILMPENVN